MRNWLLLAPLLLFQSGSASWQGGQQVIAPDSHLRYFGFAMVDGGFDDPLDSITKTNYSNEVAPFSNVAHAAVFDPAESAVSRLSYMSSLGMRAILSIEPIFFDHVPDAGVPSGSRLTLRPDYMVRWDQFRSLNAAILNSSFVQALYIADEPYWNGSSHQDVRAVSDLLESTHAELPTLIIEASGALPSLSVPTTIDWIGFDRYGVLDPANDPEYLSDLQVLRSRLSSPQQRIVIVMESQWFPEYGAMGVTPADMGYVALNYLLLARKEPRAVALIGYLWPGGFDTPTQLGARHLPASVQDIYAFIGAWIAN